MIGQLVTSMFAMFQNQKNDQKAELKLQREDNQHEEKMLQIQGENDVKKAEALDKSAQSLERAGNALNQIDGGNNY